MAITGEIRLGATEAFGSYFLAPHLAHFCTRHPSITVDLLPMPRSVNLSTRDSASSVSRGLSAAREVQSQTQPRLRTQ